MDIWYVKCSKCLYEKKLALGPYDLTQTFTDLNEDFAYYRLFVCKRENILLTANVHDSHFDNKCPTDGTLLVQVEGTPPRTCPKCSAILSAEKIDLNEVVG